MVTYGDFVDGATRAIIDASFETIVVTTVDGVLVATLLLTIGGASTLIVMEGRATKCCSIVICSKDLVKSRIEESIMDVRTSSKLERLDNVTYR